MTLSSFRKTAIALLLTLSIGAQWPLLQSFAWLNMLVSFSTEGGIKQAFAKTFDGKHLCKICKLVNEGKEAEKKSPAKDTAKKKLDPMVAQSPEIWVDRTSAVFDADDNVHSLLRVHLPLLQPPDLA